MVVFVMVWRLGGGMGRGLVGAGWIILLSIFAGVGEESDFFSL